MQMHLKRDSDMEIGDTIPAEIVQEWTFEGIDENGNSQYSEHEFRDCGYIGLNGYAVCFDAYYTLSPDGVLLEIHEVDNGFDY